MKIAIRARVAGPEAHPGRAPPRVMEAKSFICMPLPQLSVICEALTQFVDNDPVRDEGEQEPQEIGIARDLLDAAEAERVRRLT